MINSKKILLKRIAALQEKDPPVFDCSDASSTATAVRETAREMVKRNRELLAVLADTVELMDIK